MKIEDPTKLLAGRTIESADAMFDEWYKHARPIIDLIVCKQMNIGHTTATVTFQVCGYGYVFDDLIKLNPIIIPKHLVDEYAEMLRAKIPCFVDYEKSDIDLSFEFSCEKDVQLAKKRKLEDN